MRSTHRHVTGLLVGVSLGFTLMSNAACSGSSTASSTDTSASALSALITTSADGGTDPTVSTCLTTYVACLRASDADAAACKSSLLTCAAPVVLADGGIKGGRCGGGQDGGLADDGDAGDTPIFACLATLDQCAGGADTEEACVSAASTCLAAARPPHHRH